ncbi:hypothetical protein GGS23DRAFT_558957 [Durotheca rogersii]|uniref:uncharacterized protein n=1 Tax=Durotheca rogersii TaxID=419775 RepID=UPI00221FA115|nr:uncharacterized protein GGS23DRAFT_558957 [Durotheca rogersii]KAI5865375.1 hypothetical protein GGS23DRAFT_558957 [Durotheca rogersii]
MSGLGGYKSQRGQYRKIVGEHDDEDCDKANPQDDGDESDGAAIPSGAARVISRTKASHRTTHIYRLLLFALIGFNLLVSIVLLWVIIVLAQRAPHAPADAGVQLLGQAEIPVEMELYRFRTGVREKTPFFGAPNASTDAAWDTILDAGLVRLTAAQADKLSAPTARSQQDPTSYVGILEVFHQLHCLNILRKRLYASDPAVQLGDSFHTAHCFDYIRQSLMCLSDVNIAPISWSERKGEYAIHWDTVRQCRNFEGIHKWALDKSHHEVE